MKMQFDISFEEEMKRYKNYKKTRRLNRFVRQIVVKRMLAEGFKIEDIMNLEFNSLLLNKYNLDIAGYEKYMKNERSQKKITTDEQ